MRVFSGYVITQSLGNAHGTWVRISLETWTYVHVSLFYPSLYVEALPRADIPWQESFEMCEGFIISELIPDL